LAPGVLDYGAMSAKKAAKKAANKAVSEVPAKKASKKASTKKKPASGPSPDVATAAFLNYRSRVEKGLPGDQLGDWLAAENSPDV